MKINLAVYTAQEGYSWQPGTVFSAEELAEYKKRIGKFPSPDASDFPFGGVFLLADHVVFYRYHVAKKIDFRGRDALYCVLGAVSRADAAKIAPAALFATSEFAGPMKPFPTTLELPEADPSAVPEWLKNLDKMTLDVRITGSAEAPNYAVVQEPVELKDGGRTPQVDAPGCDAPAGGSDTVGSDTGMPNGDSDVGERPDQPAEPVAPGPQLQESPRKKLSRWMLVGIAVMALLIVGLSSWAVWYCWKRYMGAQEQPIRVDTPGQEAPGKNVEPAGTNVVQAVTDVPSASTNIPDAVTKAPTASTSVSIAATNQPVAVATNGVPTTSAPKKSPVPSAKPKKTSAPESPKTANPKSTAKPVKAQAKPSGKVTGKKGKGK